MIAAKNRIFLDLDAVDFPAILKRSENFNKVLTEDGSKIDD